MNKQLPTPKAFKPSPSRRTESLVNPRITVLVVVLVVAVSLVLHGAFSQASPSSNRKAINLPGDSPKAPFSGAILSGIRCTYRDALALIRKTGNAPANLDEEIKLLLDHVKDSLVEAGMTMDDLVYVQVACTDLSLYDKFNAAYRGYFTTKELPAREFIGVASLQRGGHFEIQAIGVRH